MRRSLAGLPERLRAFHHRLQPLEQVEQARRLGCILAALTEEGWIAETAQIDSSYVKAHRCSGGAKGGLEPRPLAYRAVAGRRKSMLLSTSLDDRSALR